MKPLRILCFNIHGGYDMKGRRDLKRINALLENLDVDIGVFQEMETRPSYGGKSEDVDILAGLSRPHHLPGPTLKEGEGWYGNLLISRYPIKRALVHNLETKIVLEPRNALDALIETPMGAVRIIGTHLSLSSILRWWEITSLIRLAKEVDVADDDTTKNPVFFMGDFNEWVWSSKLLRYLDERMTALPCGRTFPAFLPLFRLDRVWCDGPGVQACAQVLDGPQARVLSDHLPVLVEVKDLGKNHVV